MPSLDAAAMPSTPARPGRGERGFTLTELAIVGLLATIVMMSLSAFYISSQRMWVDGSTQALAQRDGSLMIEQLRRRVHEAKLAGVIWTDADHDELWLQYAPSDSTINFRWNSTDRRLHLWENGLNDRGPIVGTPVSRFHVTTLDSSMVELTQLELKTANGDSVSITSRFALLGR